MEHKSGHDRDELQNELTRKLSKLLRIEREYQMSQESLSERILCSRASISRMESGRNIRSEFLIAALTELDLAEHFIALIDSLLAEPPAKRARDERQRRVDAIMAPYQ